MAQPLHSLVADKGVVLEIAGDLWLVMLAANIVLAACFVVVTWHILAQRAADLPVMLNRRELALICAGVALVMAADAAAVGFAPALLADAAARVVLASIMLGAAISVVRRAITIRRER